MLFNLHIFGYVKLKKSTQNLSRAMTCKIFPLLQVMTCIFTSSGWHVWCFNFSCYMYKKNIIDIKIILVLKVTYDSDIYQRLEDNFEFIALSCLDFNLISSTHERNLTEFLGISDGSDHITRYTMVDEDEIGQFIKQTNNFALMDQHMFISIGLFS